MSRDKPALTRTGIEGRSGLAQAFCSAWQGPSLTWSGPLRQGSWCEGNDSVSQLGRSSGWSGKPLEPATAGSGVPLQVFPVVARGVKENLPCKKISQENQRWKKKVNGSRMAFRSLATNLRARPGGRGQGWES